MDRYLAVIRKAQACCDLVESSCNITSRPDVRYLWETLEGSIESAGRKETGHDRLRDCMVHLNEARWYFKYTGYTADKSPPGTLALSRDDASSEC